MVERLSPPAQGAGEGPSRSRSDSVTEAEWWTANDPESVLAVLRSLTPRQERLLAVACCHSIRKLLGEKGHQEAIALAERLADGEASEAERSAHLGDLERLRREAAHRHEEAAE